MFIPSIYYIFYSFQIGLRLYLVLDGAIDPIIIIYNTQKKGLMQIEQILAGGVGETIYKSHRQLRRSHHHVTADDLRLGRGTRSIARCLLAIGIAVGRRRR